MAKASIVVVNHNLTAEKANSINLLVLAKAPRHRYNPHNLKIGPRLPKRFSSTSFYPSSLKLVVCIIAIAIQRRQQAQTVMIQTGMTDKTLFVIILKRSYELERN